MTRPRWAFYTALFLAVILVGGPAFAQVGAPAEAPESDRDADSSEDGPSLGQSQQDQTKSQQQKNQDKQEKQDARQDQKDSKGDRSSTRAERPFRHDRPMRIERFHK